MKLPVCLQYLWLHIVIVQCLQLVHGVAQIVMFHDLEERGWLHIYTSKFTNPDSQLTLIT